MSRKDGTLNVSGTGQVKVKPDIAAVRLAVITEGKTAEEATRKNAEIVGGMIDKLARLEISRDDMKTVGLNVYPVYQADSSSGVARIVGYRTEDAIVVEAPIKLAGRVFDVGVGAGANECSGVSFAVKDERPYRAAALEAAVKAARAEAQLVCKALDVTLVGAGEITIDQGNGPVFRDSRSLVAKESTPILPGELTVTARVQIVFEYHR